MSSLGSSQGGHDVYRRKRPDRDEPTRARRPDRPESRPQGQDLPGRGRRHLGKSTRQVRRLLEALREHGDRAVVHGLRGKPSNHKADDDLKKAVLDAYAKHYPDFGPTLAAEKLAEHDLQVCPETLGAGCSTRACGSASATASRTAAAGRAAPASASWCRWTPPSTTGSRAAARQLVLIAMIDDATSRVLARFYPAGTVETHMDLLGRWLRQYGRPLAVYTDRHSIFEPQDKGEAVTEGVTQFGRALGELDIELIRAHSPQAKGRVERLFGTAQDRWVKELRLARACGRWSRPTRCWRGCCRSTTGGSARSPRTSTDAHRRLGPGHDLEAILSIQTERMVSNDYVVRFDNRFYQLLPPALPGLRGGKVVVEERLDGSLEDPLRGEIPDVQGDHPRR